MELTGPARYRIKFDPQEITRVIGPDGEKTFVSPATNRAQKLYVVLDEDEPVYIGGTKQPIRSRLRLGFQANSNNGYRGYLWRHFLTQATLEIWFLSLNVGDIEEMANDPSIVRAKKLKATEERMKDIVTEAVESETALLLQQRLGHWPKYQSEIHFHQSILRHKEIAEQIVSHYRSQ